jgi:hypothetical protein
VGLRRHAATIGATVERQELGTGTDCPIWGCPANAATLGTSLDVSAPSTGGIIDCPAWACGANAATLGASLERHGLGVDSECSIWGCAANAASLGATLDMR